MSLFNTKKYLIVFLQDRFIKNVASCEQIIHVIEHNSISSLLIKDVPVCIDKTDSLANLTTIILEDNVILVHLENKKPFTISHDYLLSVSLLTRNKIN